MLEKRAAAWMVLLIGAAFGPAGHAAAPSAETLRLTSPTAGEIWSAGSKHYVTWLASGIAPDSRLRIEYQLDGRNDWTLIASDAARTGRFFWTVPDVDATRCRLRLTAESSEPALTSSTDFAFAPSQRTTGYRWTRVTRKAAFAPRDGAGALVFNKRMWLLGGWNPSDKPHFPRVCNNEVWSSADGLDWLLEKPNTYLKGRFDATRDWEGRHTAGYVVHRNKMWIVGGDANQGHYQNDVWNSSDGRTWNLVSHGKAIPWVPRALHYTLTFRDRIWVMGGQTMPAFAPAKEVFYRDIWNSSDGKQWNRVTPQEPFWSARGMIGGNVVFRNRMWILGGGTYDTPSTPTRNFYNDVWSSADGVRWKRHVTSAPWNPRQYHDVAVFDDKMWVLEGYHKDGGNRSDVWYSSDGVNWYELEDTPWKPRHAASVFVHDHSLWMVAGNNMESDVWKLERRLVVGLTEAATHLPSGE